MLRKSNRNRNSPIPAIADLTCHYQSWALRNFLRFKTLWARRVFQVFRSNFYACKISVAFCSTKPTRPVSLCNNDIIVTCTSKPERQEHYNKFWWSILLLPNIRRVLQEHSSIHHTLNVSWIFLFLLIDSSHFECVFNLSFLFFLFLPCRYRNPPDIILANYEIQKQRVT